MKRKVDDVGDVDDVVLRRLALLADGYVQDTRMLSQRNAHTRDRLIFFRASDHAYVYVAPGEANRTFVSASTFAKVFFEEFDTDVAIEKVFHSNAWKNGTHKLQGMTSDEIKAKWNSGRDLGTIMHDNIERYLNDEQLTQEEMGTPEFQQFLDFEATWLAHAHVKVYRTEWRLYDESGYCGTLDWICAYRKQDDPDVLQMMLLDHKRCEKIKLEEKRYFGKGCCADLNDNNYVKYGLAMNLYKYMLEKNYKNVVFEGVTYKSVKVVDMWLNVMHPLHDGFQVFYVPDMGAKLVEMFAERNAAKK